MARGSFKWTPRMLVGGWAFAALANAALAQAPSASPPDASAGASATPDAPLISNLDARLFYQLLLGEIELREGEAGTAYQVMLEAARRSRNEQVFRRATDIALQARAGDQALAAIVAWRTALPSSLEALRYQVQLLVALNRAGETLEPLTTLLRLTPPAQQSALVASMPRLYAHSADRKASAELLSKALAPLLDAPETRVAARVTLARAWQAAQEPAKAIDLIRSAHEADPKAPLPALLAMELMPGSTGAEAIVEDYIRGNPEESAVRLLYARRLASAQRFGPASEQLGELTRRQPQLAAAWLTLGAVQLEARRPAEATTALKRYVQLLESGEAVAVPPIGGQTVGDAEDAATAPTPSLTEARLLLAQAAEQQRDYAAAEAWLARIDDPQRTLEVQQRRASILARQGKLKQARDLIQRVPESTTADARAKLIGEAQLLREQKSWAEADKVLARANQQFPDDVDLLYEKAMTAEKLDRMDEMERLLRRVMVLNPEHPHAYNALGYSLAERRIRLPEARELVVKALSLSPGEPFITDSLGWVEYRLGNKPEALRLLREAYQARPDPEIAAHLGEVLWASGKTDEARRVWREGKSRDASNQVLNETLTRLRVQL